MTTAGSRIHPSDSDDRAISSDPILLSFRMSPVAGGPHDDGGVLQGSACTQGDAGYGGPRFGLGKAKRGPFPNNV